MNRGPRQVQIIDDEIIMLLAVSRAYRNKPVDIITATNLDQALEQMDIFNFSLFLLDLDMKDCCSFDLLERMTRRFPTNPVILMTTGDIQSAALIDRIEKIRSQYCWHIVEKPFDYKKLIGFIDRALYESEIENPGSNQNGNSDYAEKRRCRRFSRFERINITRPMISDTSHLPPALFATLTDISVGGLSVTTGNALVSGEAVRFDEKFMHQSGTVVWSQIQEDAIYKSGIRFA